MTNQILMQRISIRTCGFTTIAVVVLIGIIFALTAPFDLLLHWFYDDSYYYFTVAKRVVSTGMSSYDGITNTNGYQPLWLVLLLPFTVVSPSDDWFLRSVLIFQTLLTGMIAILAIKLLERFFSSTAAVLSGLFLITAPFFFRLLTGGLETSILLLLVLLFTFLLYRGNWLTSNYYAVGLGLTLSFLILGRLDSILVAFAIAVGYYRYHEGHIAFSRIAVVLIAPFTLVSAYLSFNLLALDSGLMPVSMTAKSGVLLSQLWDFSIYTDTIKGFYFRRLLTDWHPFFILVPFVAVAVGLVVRPRHKYSMQVALLLVAIAIKFAAIQLAFRWTDVQPWWWIDSMMLVLVLVAWTVAYVEKLTISQRITPGRYSKVIPLTLLVVAPGILMAWLFLFFPTDAESQHSLKKQLAADIELTEIRTLATYGAVGSFGFFFDGNTVDLQGLVNDSSYLTARDEGEIKEWLRERDVRYLLGQRIGDPEITSGEYVTHNIKVTPETRVIDTSGYVLVQASNEVWRQNNSDGTADVIWALW